MHATSLSVEVTFAFRGATHPSEAFLAAQASGCPATTPSNSNISVPTHRPARRTSPGKHLHWRMSVAPARTVDVNAGQISQNRPLASA
jgi:hypothetical protein